MTQVLRSEWITYIFNYIVEFFLPISTCVCPAIKKGHIYTSENHPARTSEAHKDIMKRFFVLFERIIQLKEENREWFVQQKKIGNE